MIEFSSISFSYGEKPVLDNFSLRINDGDRICLCGESGIGKTTVLRLAMGLEKADSGCLVRTDKKMSAVFQEDRLLPFKTVGENISLFSDSDKVDYILNSLGIAEAKDEYPSALSGGMARRAAIARALAIDADLYVFDEIFTGLDDDNIRRSAELINEITSGKTVLAALHGKENAALLNCSVFDIPPLD